SLRGGTGHRPPAVRPLEKSYQIRGPGREEPLFPPGLCCAPATVLKRKINGSAAFHKVRAKTAGGGLYPEKAFPREAKSPIKRRKSHTFPQESWAFSPAAGGRSGRIHA